jgi:hypothetical protein
MVAAVLMGNFNDPVYARMLRKEPLEGETPDEADRRRRTGLVYVASTVVAVIGGYAMIIYSCSLPFWIRSSSWALTDNEMLFIHTFR